MNSYPVTVTEAVRHFSDYINRVTYCNESFTLFKGNKPVAELRPVPTGRRLGELPAILDSLPRLSAEDAAAFAADIEEAREELNRHEPRTPWES
jgi:antitoxin (DNA-binding transcriptional repressor) of toxin-antitoxin stability system